MLDCLGGEDMWVCKNGLSSGGAVIAAHHEVIFPWQLVVSGNGEGRSENGEGESRMGGLVGQAVGKRPLATHIRPREAG